ncbi:uncharacterized protein LOC123526296 [Mercenaria mercenaria]|uniref:uncharacterized protein LOC123526296 n=1 Tax=Mercenaria mercenaria TaxID=6596 RepID=UPI00234F3B0E|nr:uncharacterized protein LOC123526296 [Mercenaria mercenaria]
MADTELVAKSNENGMWNLLQTTTPTSNTEPASQTGLKIPIEKDVSGGFSYIRRTLRTQGIPRKTRDIIIKSWKASTQKQYEPYIRAWLFHCRGKDNPTNPNIKTVLTFLTKMYDRGLRYSAMDTVRSAISVFVKICGNMDLNSNETITRFMKGVFNDRPTLPRYQTTWDVQIVLDYLKQLTDTTLLQLSCKLCMLFLLLSAQRCQTLHLVDLSDVVISNERVLIYPNHLLKQSKPGSHLDVIYLSKHSWIMKICALCQYSKNTLNAQKNIRTDKKLLVRTIKPHKAVSKSTIARWVKLVLLKSGIDKSFKPHSTRAAATSLAKLKGVPLQTVIKTAGWANANMFAKFYNKPIVPKAKTLQKAILEGN